MVREETGQRQVTTVLVTGVSGLGRAKFFSKTQISTRMVQHDLGKEMAKVASERGLPHAEANILRAPTGTLAALRAAAIERIVRRISLDDDLDQLHIISAHALFLLKDRISEGLCSADVSTLKPDRLVTLIDGPQGIHERLKNHAGAYFHLGIESIVRWQEFEVFFSNHLARDEHCPHYVVPINQPDTFQRIVTGDSSLVVYASYPMTFLPADQKPLVRQFIERLKETCIVFDPASIESSHSFKPHYRASDLGAIHSHTIVRDLSWFIGINANAVVAYLPSVVFSSGMNDELMYAYENGRETYLVTEGLSQGTVPSLSPFTTYKSKVFWSTEDFFEYLTLSPQLQDAFLTVQSEMIDALRIARDSKGRVSAEQFSEQCNSALLNSMSDDWIDSHSSELQQLICRTFARWSKVLSAIAAGSLSQDGEDSNGQPSDEQIVMGSDLNDDIG